MTSRRDRLKAWLDDAVTDKPAARRVGRILLVCAATLSFTGFLLTRVTQQLIDGSKDALRVDLPSSASTLLEIGRSANTVALLTSASAVIAAAAAGFALRLSRGGPVEDARQLLDRFVAATAGLQQDFATKSAAIDAATAEYNGLGELLALTTSQAEAIRSEFREAARPGERLSTRWAVVTLVLTVGFFVLGHFWK